MYFKPSTIFALTTLHTITSATSIVGPTCEKLPSAVGPKLDIAYDQYYKTLCNHGCQPIVGGKYTSLMSEAILKPAVQTISINLGIDHDHIEAFLRITDESMQAVEQHCSHLITTDFCQHTDAFPEYAACAKGQIFTVITSHPLDVAPLISEEVCRKELEYFTKEELWDSVLPGYVEDFWRVCETWS
ncbi:uncharacterized protein BO80DRAFT_476901 [Aspergillus ibericus CBS 121593]|uniref:Uncharacterized protein n=1 Tax=Aspergillus ibericus CBS 121593 TaxID=1448316 RepID=A0A395GWJ9_9EURO|nr:hypothetical protein BO80DRAFT_476901 [Aspergillus ibericus CBS 121593]RAK99916.1 hypothetical protein BO80DRAFT_476901 [Aspergillus ibericus CBS 121593]